MHGTHFSAYAKSKIHYEISTMAKSTTTLVRPGYSACMSHSSAREELSKSSTHYERVIVKVTMIVGVTVCHPKQCLLVRLMMVVFAV